jgi:hypothetical protein
VEISPGCRGRSGKASRTAANLPVSTVELPFPRTECALACTQILPGVRCPVRLAQQLDRRARGDPRLTGAAAPLYKK